MSIFGVSAEQVRLIVREELKQYNLDKQLRNVESELNVAVKAVADAAKEDDRPTGYCEDLRRAYLNNRRNTSSCRHYIREGGRSIRIACDGSCKSKQERYQEKLKQLRELSRGLSMGERRLASLEFELKHYTSDGYAISAMHHACLNQRIEMQSQDNCKLFNRLHKILDELSTLNVI